jgi:hypothetical protein
MGGKALTNQRKKGRPRSENPMVHTALVLPRDLLERLRKAAEVSDHGLSTEIRERLQLTCDLEGFPSDPVMNDLLNSIRLLADNLAGDLGEKWHQNPDALAAFKAGVATFLALYRPESDESARPDTRVVGELPDPPDAVGRTHARLILNAKRRGELPSDLPSEYWNEAKPHE